MIDRNIIIRRHFGFLWWKRSTTIVGKVLDKVADDDGKEYYLIGLPSGEVVKFDPLSTNFIIT